MECFTKFCVYLVFLIVTIHGVTAALLTPCTNTAACTVSGGDPNAVCSTVAGADGNKNCICTGAFKNNAADDGCVAKGLLDVCANTAACIVVGGEQNAICSNNVSMGGDTDGNCICTGAFKNNANNNGCVAKEITTIVCNPGATGTAECQKIDANSECKTGVKKCACKAGYKVTGSCIKVLGGTCTSPGDCTTPVHNSVCSSGDKCECKANYIEESAICKGVITDTTCTSDNDGAKTCRDIDSNAECPTEGTQCACKADYFLNSGKTTCVKKITSVGCSPGDAGTAACKLVDPNSECPAGGTKCACKTGYTGTDSCTKDAGSSATSAWMTTNWFVTAVLMYLPRLICG